MSSPGPQKYHHTNKQTQTQPSTRFWNEIHSSHQLVVVLMIWVAGTAADWRYWLCVWSSLTPCSKCRDKSYTVPQSFTLLTYSWSILHSPHATNVKIVVLIEIPTGQGRRCLLIVLERQNGQTQNDQSRMTMRESFLHTAHTSQLRRQTRKPGLQKG